MRLWIALTILFIVPCVAGSQTPPQEEKRPPAAAAESSADAGLLLGAYFPNGMGSDGLSSILETDKWVPEILMEPHGKYLTFWIARVGDTVMIRVIDGLLVPRKNGFWRVGTQIVKSDETEDPSYDERFWALPTGRNPSDPTPDSQIDGKSIRLITYVGSDYISYLFHWQGGAGAWE